MLDLLDAHIFMMRRYRDIITGRGFEDETFLVNFCEEAIAIKNPDKLSRWVGFIQGTLIERNVIDTDFERLLSRNLYKPIYEKLGYDTTTIDVSKG